MDNSGGGFRLTSGRTSFTPPNNQPLLFRPQQQQFQQSSAGLPGSSQQFGGTPLVPPPARMPAPGNITQAAQFQQQQQQQFGVPANGGAPTLLAAIKAMQAAAAAQGKTLQAPAGPNTQQQSQGPAQAMPAPVRQPSGLQALPARPQQQQRRPAASQQPSAPPASNDHQALLQQVQAALAKAQQQQQQQQQQQTYKGAPPPPPAAAAGFSAEPPAPTSMAAAQQGQEAAASAGPQRPRMAPDELLQLVQAQLQKQQQQRAPAGPTRQPSNAAVAAPAPAPAEAPAGQRPAAPGMNPIQQQLLQQVLTVIAANGSSSNAHPAAGAPGASAMQAVHQQQPAAAGAAGAQTDLLPPSVGAGLTPQQQQLLQQILSATGVAASAGSGPSAGAHPKSHAGARMSCAAPAAGGLAAAAAAGFEAAGVLAGQPAAAAVDHTVATPCAPGQQGGSSSKGLDMAALLQQVLRAASAQQPRQPNSSTTNTNKGVDQQAGAQHQQELLQPEGLSTEVLTLLTMIAASAVCGAAESSASGRPLSAVVNPRVLAASKRFLSILVSINDSSSTADGEEALEALAAAAAAGVPPPQGGAGGASDAHVAAAALCSLPVDPSGSGGDGLRGSRPGWASRGGEEHGGDWYVPDEPLVGGSIMQRERHTAAGSRPAHGGRPPTGYSRRGGGAKPQGSEGGGRSGLLALLRAVEETDQDCSDPAGEDLMDWAAAAADVGGADDDQPDRSYGGRGRRTARGKRPRYGPEHSSIHSDSGYSYDSTGQDSRRWDAAGAAAAGAHSDGVGWSDREQEQGEGAWEGSRRQRQRTGYTHGRIRRTNDDNYIYGDDLDSVADAALLAAAAAAGGQRGSGKPGPKAAAAAAARAPSPAAAVQQQGPKRHRCVAGNNQWLTEDGLTVWPKDTVVTRDQRVFYVAFKWVQEHWPRNVEEGEHIADVPISLFLDNQEVPNLVYNFKAKIRVYNTAAHLVISPYSKLSSVYSGCFIAGYAYNHHTGAIRVYLTRERPDLSAPPGRPIRQLQHPGDDAAPRQHHVPPLAADPAAAAAMPAPAERSSGSGTPPAAADTGLDRAFAAAMAVADELPELQALVDAVDAQALAWVAAAEPAAQAMANGVVHNATKADSRSAAVGAAAAALAAPGKEQQQQQQQQPEEMQADAAAAAAAAAPVGGSSPSSGADIDQQQAAADAAAAPCPQQAASASDGSSDVGGSEDGGPDAQRWEQLQQQLGALQARDVPVDASVINNAVLSVSDALQLPDDLLAELPNRLLQTLQAATAPGSSSGIGSQAGRRLEGAAAADDGSDAVAQAGSDSGKGGPPSPDAVLAALQGWYQRLCGAVAARDGQQVTKLVKQLGHEVLVAGQ